MVRSDKSSRRLSTPIGEHLLVFVVTLPARFKGEDDEQRRRRPTTCTPLHTLLVVVRPCRLLVDHGSEGNSGRGRHVPFFASLLSPLVVIFRIVGNAIFC